MAIPERIQERVQELPQQLQLEVLHFAEYLLARTEREATDTGDSDWYTLSLDFAMRDMEEEEQPIYTAADLAVVFS